MHEAYIRLVDVEKAQHWNGRGHFFGAAAEAMRRILVDQDRQPKAAKRGGGAQREELHDVAIVAGRPIEELLAVDAPARTPAGAARRDSGDPTASARDAPP